jgi:hypothetical protein
MLMRVGSLRRALAVLMLTHVLTAAFSCTSDQHTEVSDLWVSFTVRSDAGSEEHLQMWRHRDDYTVLYFPVRSRVTGTLTASQRARLETLLAAERISKYQSDSRFVDPSDPNTPDCDPALQMATKTYVLVTTENRVFCWAAGDIRSPETLELVMELEAIIGSNAD